MTGLVEPLREGWSTLPDMLVLGAKSRNRSHCFRLRLGTSVRLGQLRVDSPVTQSTSSQAARPAAGRLRRWLTQLTIVSAYAYPLALIATWLALGQVGESYWVTAALLYAPRVGFALPLLLLVPALLILRLRRLLWTQGVALLICLFPLMGLVLPGFSDSGNPTLKLLTFNVGGEQAGAEALLRDIEAEGVDVVLLQEANPWEGELLEGLKRRYPHTHASTQFMLGSRYPIVEATDPPRVPFFGRQRSPRFMRYVVDTPLGKLAIYNVHPLSPRGTLNIGRFRDTFHQVRTGKFLEGDAEADVTANAALRSNQVALVAKMAQAEQLPVLIAGDTNTPGLSPAFRRHLGQYRDAFRRASYGFGYTYPQRLPFLRLDRVLASPELGFCSFTLGCADSSDHFCVVTEVVKL